MKKPNKLKLLAVGDRLINDYNALSASPPRYIGRKWDPALKGYKASEASEVSPLPEYVKAVQRGDLAPGDQITADYCGVPFSAVVSSEFVTVAGTPFNGKF